MMLAVGMILIAVSVASFAADGFQYYIDQLPAGAYAWALIQPGIALVFNAIVFTIIYRVIPKVSIGWLEALIGGVAVSIIWHLGQLVLARIVISSKYSAYGVVGSFVAIMAWMYYASATIFLGAEFVQVLWHSWRGGEKPSTISKP
jgi:membrane protein